MRKYGISIHITPERAEDLKIGARGKRDVRRSGEEMVKRYFHD